MKIGFVGSGPVATHLGKPFSSAGHAVTLGKRSADNSSFLEAIAGAEVVNVAIPFRARAEALPPLAQALTGKIVVDATNPLKADYSPLSIEDGGSAAEAIAGMLPRSRIVKAFNSIFADNMTEARVLRPEGRLTAFLCGDEPDANAKVARLASDAGFEPLEFRPLSTARYLEAMTHLLIANGFAMGRGTEGGFRFS